MNLNGSLQPLLDQEMDFLAAIFYSDAKNYHAWSHKIWLIERYSLWREPRHLVFADQLLDKDVQNNSAWSFRYFIVMRSAKSFDKALVEQECKYALEKRLSENWGNEAAWAYMRGMLANTEEEAKNSIGTNAPRLFIGEIEWLGPLLEKWSQWAESDKFSQDMVEKFDGADQDEILSRANMRFAGLKQNRFFYATIADCNIASKNYDKAVEILDKVKDFDPIRKKFWEWRKQRALQLK